MIDFRAKRKETTQMTPRAALETVRTYPPTSVTSCACPCSAAPFHFILRRVRGAPAPLGRGSPIEGASRTVLVKPRRTYPTLSQR